MKIEYTIPDPIRPSSKLMIAGLRRNGMHTVADRIEEQEAEIAELRATVRLKSALIGVAARVVSEAA